jgi:hypothetical protein
MLAFSFLFSFALTRFYATPFTLRRIFVVALGSERTHGDRIANVRSKDV